MNYLGCNVLATNRPVQNGKSKDTIRWSKTLIFDGLVERIRHLRPGNLFGSTQFYN